MPNTPIGITNHLDTIHGGRGAGRAAVNIARRAGDALEKIGGWAGGGLAIKEGWDWLRGNNSQPQAPAQQQPSTPSE